jgi:cytochrome P450 family 109
MTEAAVSDELYTERPAYYWDPRTPIRYDAKLGCWNVFAYDDVVQVLSDRNGRFSQAVSDEVRLFGNPTLAGLWATEGKRHGDLLALVSPAFRRTTVDPPDDKAPAPLKAHIRDVVTELIDAATATTTAAGQFEAVSTIAHPLPGHVMCDLLGIDRAAAERMHQWRDEAWKLRGTSKAMPDQPDMTAYLEQLVEEHRQTPQPGLLGDLLTAQDDPRAMIDGQRLTTRDIVGYVAMLLWGGGETTAAAAADALVFHSESGHWQTLRDDPSLIPDANEELFRLCPSFPGVELLVMQDTRIGGQQLRAGERAIVWLTAANRDPRYFKDPNTVDIRRKPNPHVTFGVGAHHCLGAPLARLELRILVEEVTQRLPHLRRATDLPFRRRVWTGMEDSVDEVHFRY